MWGIIQAKMLASKGIFAPYFNNGVDLRSKSWRREPHNKSLLLLRLNVIIRTGKRGLRMRFSDLLYSFIPSGFRGTEAQKAVDEFVSNIPGRIMQIEFDNTKSNKQGIKHDSEVYKLGLDLSAEVVYIQYYENFNQGQPTMAIFIDRKNHAITVNGWTVEKSCIYCFRWKTETLEKRLR